MALSPNFPSNWYEAVLKVIPSDGEWGFRRTEKAEFFPTWRRLFLVSYREFREMNKATQLIEIASARLVGEGAVMTVWNSPPEAFLVGRAQCLDDRRFFFFAANGNGAADAHVVEFDASQPEQDAVRFFLKGKLAGLLTSVKLADVADREDYQVGWQIWQAVAPMKQSHIDRLVNDLDPE